jgi:hypothetical protein
VFDIGIFVHMKLILQQREPFPLHKQRNSGYLAHNLYAGGWPVRPKLVALCYHRRKKRKHRPKLHIDGKTEINSQKLLIVWTSWRNVSRWGVWFMHGYLLFQQWRELPAPLTICCHLQLVSSVFRRGAVYFTATCVSVHLREMRIYQKLSDKISLWKNSRREVVHNLVNKLEISGTLKRKKNISAECLLRRS